MKKPETVYMVTAIFDGDAPSEVTLYWERKDAVAQMVKYHDYMSVSITEHHPEKGRRELLDYAPYAGLEARGPYTTWDKRWREGYPADFVRAWLDQWPNFPIRLGWKR